MEADVGVIGLAVMGQNLVLNIVEHGYTVAVFNRTTKTMEDFVRQSQKSNIIGSETISELVASLKHPRKVLLMLKAGKAVDDTINVLMPLLEQGDVIIDGGNSNYQDSTRRAQELQAHGFHFIGAGISGGEEGARYGPSIMPGGTPAAWPLVKDLFQSISAKVDDQTPCCEWVGQEGAGHYVKMVHNGIEYGDMQLITEVYHIMREGLGMDPPEIADVFARWNRGVLESYLVEITSEILRFIDDDGEPLVDKILDTAGQKGTGRWTALSSLELGTPLSLITEAVYQRSLSSMKDLRVKAAAFYQTSKVDKTISTDESLLNALEEALYASKIVSYSQGFQLLRAAAEEFGWDLNYGGIALMWRGGCIIRSAFLGKIKEAFDQNPDLEVLLLYTFFHQEVGRCLTSWRRVVARAVEAGIPIPGLASALTYFDSLTSAVLPANLLQAQRDFFGAHGYERVDRERGTFFHTEWRKLS